MSSSPKEIVERILRNDQVHPIEVEQQDLKQVGSSKKVGQSRPLFVYFSFFSHDKYSTNMTINDKAEMVCLRLEPGAAVW